MTTPVPRTPVRPGRGTKANLDIALAAGDIKEGEIVYAKDQDKLYIVEAGVFVAAGGGGGGSTVASINDLTDVDTATDPPVASDALIWDGTNWVPGAVSISLGRGDGGDIDLGTSGSGFVFGVYGGGDVDATGEDLPVEMLGAADGGEVT